jgi:hypothetical protein
MNSNRLYARIRLQVALKLARDLRRGDFSRFVDGRGQTIYTAKDCRRNIKVICNDEIVARCYPITAKMLAGWVAMR